MHSDAVCSNGEALIKSRNFDPESRTLKKRTREDAAAMEDTIEKNVEGMAQMIIKDDEDRRAQELVSVLCVMDHDRIQPVRRMSSTLRPNGRIGI